MPLTELTERASVSSVSGLRTHFARNLSGLGLDPLVHRGFIDRRPVAGSIPPHRRVEIPSAGRGKLRACEALGPCQTFIGTASAGRRPASIPVETVRISP
jgi:hypothetical protein